MNKILITGGTGTFGQAFVNYIHKSKTPIERVIIYSRDEYKQHWLEKQYIKDFGVEYCRKHIRFFIGDVRDKNRLLIALDGVDTIFHAAALKHVHLCEYNPGEAINTNINGSLNVAAAAIQKKVDKVVALSTDKAVEPINLYGATKMVAEKNFIYSNNYSNHTRFNCIRYGNIIGSRGSILEVFDSQKDNEFFTLTDPDMTRFLLHIDQAVTLSLQAVNAPAGLTLVPYAKSTTIKDLAIAFDPAKPHKTIGIRPGEKNHEILANKSELTRMIKPKKSYYAILPETHEWTEEIIPSASGLFIKPRGNLSSFETERFTPAELQNIIDDYRNYNSGEN